MSNPDDQRDALPDIPASWPEGAWTQPQEEKEAELPEPELPAHSPLAADEARWDGADFAGWDPPSGTPYPPAVSTVSAPALEVNTSYYSTMPPPQPARHVSGNTVPAKAYVGLSLLALLMGLFGGLIGTVVGNQVGGGPSDDLVSSESRDPAAGDGLDPGDTRTDAPLNNGSIESVAAEVLPSTVQVVAFRGEDGGTGSGFVLDNQGHVVTNNHVIEAAAEGGTIQIVDQDGRRMKATLVGRSAVYDLAVLYARGARSLTPASLGESNELVVGEAVVAFGSPLGLTSTVTSGIVSALNRPVSVGDSANSASYINAVQTDAAINPGNSGGPLVDLDGQVVGVNSAIATAGGIEGQAGNIGVGFSIPIEQVRITADQILRKGEATYPIIGASLAPDEEFGLGASIGEITADSPADRANLRVGDRIVEVDGQKVFDGIGVIVAIRTHLPGESIDLTINRSGTRRTVTVVLASRVG